MNRPFLLTPAPKNYLWGGSRLNDEFNYGCQVFPFAEAWVCSTHPDGSSGVPEFDCNLSELLKQHPEYLGTHASLINSGELPILIKLIDARQKLSVQVHPDDEYASDCEGGLGKTEMWYVLDAKQNASLVYGFQQDVTAEQIRDSVKNGTIETLLNHVNVSTNDLFFIESGTVHAIGAGCLIAEIQENSNLTYRLYDYDRTDKYGKKRELHLDKALAVMKMGRSNAPRQPMRLLRYCSGYATELLVRCKYFQVERMLLNTEGRKLAEFKTEDNSFHVLLCVGGCGNISGMNFSLNFFKGDCIFIPADSIPLKLHGKAQILSVSC